MPFIVNVHLKSAQPATSRPFAEGATNLEARVKSLDARLAALEALAQSRAKK